MVFLLLSVEYPSAKHRSKFVRNAGPHSKVSSPFHKPLAASATDDEWRRVLKAIRESVTDEYFLHEQASPRPLRPNDDNYQVRNPWELDCLCSFVRSFVRLPCDAFVTMLLTPILLSFDQNCNITKRCSLEANGSPRAPLTFKEEIRR